MASITAVLKLLRMTPEQQLGGQDVTSRPGWKEVEEGLLSNVQRDLVQHSERGNISTQLQWRKIVAQERAFFRESVLFNKIPLEGVQFCEM